ncbi:hypothetical protein GCM10028796_29290 [Ramlibacter monticola]|uniref:Transporter n=1 Tax=Ramlibacter monticola TaxID=1926872 RepID=A0A937CS44_9BURK|nr:hypothetical protein [Ramlibacter monticola]MBL0390721.1 hypothetical protein [Ramlibacter monticola]
MRSASLFLLLAGVAGAASAAGAPAADDRLEMHVTHEVTTGGMDEPSGVPVRQSTLGVRYRAENWTLQADVPWRRVAGLGEAGTPRLPGTHDTEQGLAEARVKVVVPLRQAAPDDTRLDLVLRMQTASSAAVGGVSPGNAGQSLRLAMQRALGDWNVFGHLGWRRAGTLPGTDPGRNAWHGEVGVSHPLASRIEAGVYADLRQRVGTEGALPEATLYTALNDGDRTWQAFVRRAFASSAPDVAIGLSYRTGF